jgi:anti-sigma factor RsiW
VSIERNELDELLGAYALDAVSDEERQAIEEYLLVDPRARQEVAEHREVATLLAWTGTAAPDVPDGVVVLVDRKPTLIPAQNVVALYRRNELNQMQLRAINEIAGVLDTAALVDMLRQVRAGADPRSVAEAWLTANPLGR